MAAERGLLVMGPDCGTAIVGGVGLGFANAVRSGPVGVVAASGTGAQQLTCLLDLAGVGCSAVLGLGGRDLSAAVGGRSARAALEAIDEDPATEFIVVVSKPPAPEVAATLRHYAGTLSKPVHFALVDPGQPDLTDAAETVLRAIGASVPTWPTWLPQASGVQGRAGGGLLGLFSGGTLCDEATVIATERIDGRHAMIDFGADELTQGRPHPMIDQRLRLDRLAAEAADSVTAVIMLDCVLGFGAHPDPAADLAPAIAAARTGNDIEIVISLIGTHADPQGLAAQAAAFTRAGAHVFASNAQGARFACDLLEPRS
jgi:FdrA protein